MKTKPDIRAFAGDKDPSAFLEGGAGDRPMRAKTAAEPLAPTKPEPTVQKLFRLRWDVANALKMAAAQETISSGKRVTETEIVEALIRQRLKIAR
jgi:hypothetical protein